MRTTIASHKRSPREQRERNTALRLAALLDACFNRPTPTIDPDFDLPDGWSLADDHNPPHGLYRTRSQTPRNPVSYHQETGWEATPNTGETK